MISIEQLLESVDLDFEPRFVTKDEDGEVWIWNIRPDKNANWYLKKGTPNTFRALFITDKIKISEFADKPWQECIYEVPRKTTEKIEKLLEQKLTIGKTTYKYPTQAMLMDKINELVDAVNKHADIIKQIGDWGTRKGECLWCETLTKFEPNESKGAKNE